MNRAAFIGPLRQHEHLGEQGGAEPVRGDRVEASVLDEHRHVVHGVDQLLHVRPDLLRPGRAAATAGVGALVRGPDQVVEVGVFGLVELQGPADAVQDGLGDAGRVAAFEPHVVLGAHPGEQGDLFAAQTLHAAAAAEVGQARPAAG